MIYRDKNLWLSLVVIALYAYTPIAFIFINDIVLHHTLLLFLDIVLALGLMSVDARSLILGIPLSTLYEIPPREK